MDLCPDEKAKFCSDQNDFRGLVECLVRHDSELSKSCKQEVDRMIQARKQAAARGGGALTSFGGANAMGPPVPFVSYEGRITPGTNATGQVENKFNISSPVYKNATDTVGLSLAAGQVHLSETLHLDSGQDLATDYSRFEIGTQFMRQLADKKNWGMRASVGYAGDRPSEAGKDLSYSLSGSYGFPGTGQSYWVALVFMANNSPLANYVPIPGVLYIYRAEKFSGSFGFPVTSLQWTPIDPWQFSLSIFGLNLQTEAAYGHLDSLQTFFAYTMSQQTFIPAVRINDRDRLTLREEKVSLGLRAPVMGLLQAEIQAGRSFNRSAYIGRGFNNKDGGSANMSSDNFASVAVRCAF